MKRVLVINDTQEILDLFDEILSEEGYEVYQYSYAIRDMAEIERVNPDVIILDLMFGGEATGWQLLQKLRMRRSTAHIPIVLCTAATNSVRETEGYLQSQGVCLVLKPFQIDDLLQSVERAVTIPEKVATLAMAASNGQSDTVESLPE